MDAVLPFMECVYGKGGAAREAAHVNRTHTHTVLPFMDAVLPFTDAVLPFTDAVLTSEEELERLAARASDTEAAVALAAAVSSLEE
eukprot:60813-Rhodomonas_salina.1